VSFPSKHEFTTEEVLALYYFLRRECLDHHIPTLEEAVNHICNIAIMAEHELATRDSQAT
jgi:hypothetical protein